MMFVLTDDGIDGETIRKKLDFCRKVYRQFI